MTRMMPFILLITYYCLAGVVAWNVHLEHYGWATFNAFTNLGLLVLFSRNLDR